MTEQKVSHRYAQALFGTAKEANLIEQVYQDFSTVSAVLDSSRELVALTKNPVFQQWRKKKIYEEIFTGKVSDLSLNFLILLIDKRRGELIPSIIVQFTNIYNQYNKILPVGVCSAIELSDELKDKIKKILDERTEMNTVPSFSVDPAIKGGIIVRIEDQMFDGSVRNQLAVLFHKLAEGNSVSA